MAMAADADKEEEYNRILVLIWQLGTIDRATQADFDRVWSRMSIVMRKYGSSQFWTLQKVKYAWNNGISARFLNINVYPFLR
jgi:hypothetical protein